MVKTDTSSMTELKQVDTYTTAARSETWCSGPTDQQTLMQAIREHKKLVWYIISLMGGVILYGYDAVVVGTVSSLLAFQSAYGETFEGRLIVPSNWLAAWKAASPLGTMLGAMLGGVICSKLGRRLTLVIGTIIAAVGVALCVVSGFLPDIMVRRALFAVAKLVQGNGIGQIIVAVQTYVSEVCPPRLRGSAMSLIPLTTLLGQLIGAAVIAAEAGNMTKWAYIVPLASQLAFMIPPIVTAICVPESPVYLLTKQKRASAEKALARLNREDTDVTALADKMEDALCSTSNKEKASPLDCFKGKERKRTFIILLSYASPQLWGLTLLANASYFMQTVGMSEKASLLLLVLGIILGMIGNFISIWSLSRFGRRPLILLGFGLCGLVWIGMGVANCFESEVTIWYSTASLMLVIVIAGVSCWPAFVALGAEVSSLSLRSQSQGIGWSFGSMMTCIFSVALPYIYNLDAGDLRGKTAFVYAGLSALCLVVSFFFVPETKDLNTTQIDKLFLSEKEQRQAWAAEEVSMSGDLSELPAQDAPIEMPPRIKDPATKRFTMLLYRITP